MFNFHPYPLVASMDKTPYTAYLYLVEQLSKQQIKTESFIWKTPNSWGLIVQRLSTTASFGDRMMEMQENNKH